MKPPPGIPSPLEFFGHLTWLDGQPLLDTIDDYRARIFMDALWSFRNDGLPAINLVLAGRGKKNWKTADLVLACLYRLLIWESPAGADCFLLANDEDQAGDDLTLTKKIIEANPSLGQEVDLLAKAIKRKDGGGTLQILPAQDAAGAHGKTYSLCAFDEIHAYRNWDLFEALAPDPTRPDSLTWITSYASIFNHTGAPLYDLCKMGKAGDDPRMYFSWYAGDYCTDPAFAERETPEERANPSMGSWPEGRAYLDQQKRRLPSHKYRRLHLNLPGLPDGAALSADHVMDAIVEGRKRLPPTEGRKYRAFVDMSGGSNDDAVLAIGHANGSVPVLDYIANQGGGAPFNPRNAVRKFAGVLKEYGLRTVTGDAYAGETFRRDFQENGIQYLKASADRTQLYEALEPKLNAGEVEFLDVGKLQEQLLGLVWRGRRIDHQTGEHDDWANAAAGVVWLFRKPKFDGPRAWFPGEVQEGSLPPGQWISNG